MASSASSSSSSSSSPASTAAGSTPSPMSGVRGLLIVLEGGDGVGKTSTARRLAAELDALLLFSPDRSTPTGVLLDRYLQGDALMHEFWDDTVAQTVFTANRLEKRKVIYEALMMGRDVVMDRYTLSAAVYGSLNGVDEDWLVSLMHLDWFPDVTFVLDIPDSKEQVYLERAKFTDRESLQVESGSELYDRYEFQRRVRVQFREFVEAETIGVDSSVFKDQVVDVSGSLDEVIAHIARVVNDQVRPLRASRPLEMWKDYILRRGL